jgi:hypothetical protein
MDPNEERGKWLAPVGYAFATLGILVAFTMISLPFVLIWLITRGSGVAD